MDKELLAQKLKELKEKQKLVEQTWQKTGNRGLIAFFIEIIPKLLDAQRASIFILDPEAEKAWLQSGTGMSEREIEVPTKVSMVGKAIATGETQRASHLEDKAGSHEIVDMQTGFQTYNAICIPIRGASKDIVTGAIQVLNKHGRVDFTDEDCEMLEKFAQQLRNNVESIFQKQELAKIAKEMSRKIVKIEEMLK